MPAMFMQCNIEMDGQRDNPYVCDRCLSLKIATYAIVFARAFGNTESDLGIVSRVQRVQRVESSFTRTKRIPTIAYNSI